VRFGLIPPGSIERKKKRGKFLYSDASFPKPYGRWDIERGGEKREEIHLPQGVEERRRNLGNIVSFFASFSGLNDQHLHRKGEKTFVSPHEYFSCFSQKGKKKRKEGEKGAPLVGGAPRQFGEFLRKALRP